jgi:hypothetical protein
MNTELEQRLRGDMERATQGVRVPPGLALRAYRHNQKRTRTARTVTGAAAVTALAAAAVAGAGVSGAFGPAIGQQTKMTTYVVSRVEHALSAPGLNNMVGFARTAYPAGVTLQPKPGGMTGSGGPAGSSPRSATNELVWAYHHASKMSAFTATGRHLFDERITKGHGPAATTAVLYPSHTWWTATGIAGPAGNRPPSSSCPPGGDIRLNGGTNAWPAFIRSQLACGAYTVTGKRAVVDNVNAIEITGNSGHLTLWVNRTTYLPVRLDDGPIQTSFRWLPPTPANRAQLNMPIPAGFHQVPPPS